MRRVGHGLTDSREDNGLDPTYERPPEILVSIVGGLFAAVVAAASMAFLRSVLQVRTIPERVMEWVLLFIPPDVFEAGIRRFGFDAKRYALYGAMVGMVLLLTALGALALRRRWPSRALLAVGLG